MKTRMRSLSSVLICMVMTFALFHFNVQASDNGIAYCGDQEFVQKMNAIVTATDLKVTTGKIYYVATNGKDSWKGTKKKPFGTFRYALSKLKKGDTLYIRGGTYQEKLQLKSSLKGSADAYIMISNMPGENVVLDGSNKHSPVLVEVNGASFVKISGLELCNANGQSACGIRVHAKSNHLVMSGNKIHNIEVPDPKVEDHCANGILLFGDSAANAIHDVLIYQNQLYDCQTGWAECVSVTGNTNNINLIGNTITNTGNIGIDLSGNYGYCKNPAVDFPRNCLVYKNTVRKCVSQYATSYGIYVDGGQQIAIDSNKVQRCSGGIEIGAEQKPKKEAYATSDIIVKNNSIKDNIENGITIGGYAKNLGWVNRVQLYKNQCRNNGLHNAILTLAKCKDITLQNNLFHNDSGDAAVIYSEFSNKYTKNIVFLNNTYYNGHAKDDTCFVYLGKTDTSFDKWKMKAGSNAGIYKK